MRKIVFVNGSPKRGGATDELVSMIIKYLDKSMFERRVLNLSDYSINYCLGCKACYDTGECVLQDGMTKILAEIDAADVVVMVSPSYWADITGQMKVFIDRCTPWCDTHEPHARLSGRKIGYIAALRTGWNPGECLHIIDSIRHFYGHMGIAFEDSLYLCGISSAEDVRGYEENIKKFAGIIG